MAVFLWTDEFRTGLDEVDRQHRHLVDMLNDLDEARAIGSDAQLMLKLLDGLSSYTQYHFATEEKMMGAPSFDPDEMQRHLAQHHAFIEKVARVQQEAHRDPTVVSDDLVDFLVHWLTRHILGTDQKMAALLLDQPTESDQTDVGANALVRALRESEARFRGMADHVPALIWMSDSEGRRSYHNLQWSRFTGLAQEQLQQDNWLECVHPDDTERMRRLHTPGGDEHEEQQAEFRLRRDDGRYRWFWETTVPRLQNDGTFAGEVGCAIDITERRQVEKLLRSAKQRLEAMVEERTAQLSKANEVLQQRYKEQQALTRELQQTQTQLLQSEKMAGIGQLAAGVAHEINNPIGYVYSNLSSLKGYTDDLLSLIDSYAELEDRLPPDDAVLARIRQARQELDLDFLREDIPQVLNESMQGADRARQIVQHLKDFTGVEQQESAPFDLEAGLQSTLDLVDGQVSPDIRIKKEFSGLQPVICVGPELNQVFLQLLNNAVQALRGNGCITLRSGSDGKDWVWLEVEDNGHGIPPEDLKRLFDPFFTTRPVGQGTGMGLALAYNIIDRHGGNIEVHSQVGSGSRFRIRLPKSAEAER